MNTVVRVLLVEDNAADAALLRESLRESKYGRFRIDHVKRLEEALARLEQEAFNVILLDLGLPDSQGLDALARMVQRAGTVPVVVLTGLSDEALALRALQEGAQDYIVKGNGGAGGVDRAIRYATERHRAEEAFRASEQRLALAVNAVRTAIWDWDVRTGEVSWSLCYAELLGLDSKQIPHNYELFEQCVHPDGRAAMTRALEHALSSPAQKLHYEFRVIRPDGTVYWIEARGRVGRDEEGRAVRVMGTLVEITDRKVAEESARRRDAELAHMSRVSTMAQMASGLAHELNQPLSAILNYATAGLEQIESPAEASREMVASAMQELMNEARRAGAIIQRLRCFVRRQQPHRAASDVNELVAEAIAILGFELRQNAIVPTLRLAPAPPAVLVDAIQIEQVLVNLIYNALEAMQDPRLARRELTLETALRADRGEVEVRVIDTGCGASTDDISHLFDPFFTTKAEGLGMGLNISRSIIEAHGGTIVGAANPAGGMVFSFTLPAASEGGRHHD